jgi:hypothetical protein
MRVLLALALSASALLTTTAQAHTQPVVPKYRCMAKPALIVLTNGSTPPIGANMLEAPVLFPFAPAMLERQIIREEPKPKYPHEAVKVELEYYAKPLLAPPDNTMSCQVLTRE